MAGTAQGKEEEGGGSPREKRRGDPTGKKEEVAHGKEGED